MHKQNLIQLLTLMCLIAAVAACESESGNTGTTDGDADGDTDSDGDADGDSDTDSDGDSDGDSDTDIDGDTDTDTDTDADSDTRSSENQKPDCIDADGDGWCLPFDCDDGNADINPGATEDYSNDIDENCDGETDSDQGNDSPLNPNDICENNQCSYIWIANSAESTMSKVNTYNAKEVARYRTCPGTGLLDCDPSRTSVNLHGDPVVTNRYPETDGKSSVTKFAALRADCVDQNGDGAITTSTGPDDVLPFGEDECMLWHRDLGNVGTSAPRARATAWDGSEDPDTGAGGQVLIGTCIAGANGEWDLVNNNQIYVLNGDTGVIEDEITIPNTECFYGAAMDGNRNLWIMDGYGFPSSAGAGGLIRLNLDTQATSFFDEQCGYGISVDSDGNVWTGGKHWWSPTPPSIESCVQKFNSATETATVTTNFTGGTFLRGIAVGAGRSAGYVWAAERRGSLYKISQSNLADVTIINTPAYNATSNCASYEVCPNNLVGVAIDFEGYVWSVSTVDNAAYKYDPDTGTFESVTIGIDPYTYSDMTGMQLKGAVIID